MKFVSIASIFLTLFCLSFGGGNSAQTPAFPVTEFPVTAPLPPAIALLANGQPLGNTVSPDARGLVTFTARSRAGDALLQRAFLSAPNSSANTFFTPTAGPVDLSVYWSVRYKANGAQATVTASTTDTAGLTTVKSATVILVR